MIIKNYFFYLVKPLIPRNIQISLRRRIANIKRQANQDIWPIDEKTGTPPSGWKGWPQDKKFALVLQHDVDTQKGHDNCRRLMDLEEKLGVRSTFYFVPERYSVSRQLLAEIKQRGFGLGVHGLKHDGKLFLSYEKFQNDANKVNAYIRDWKVRGFSAPSMISRIDWMHHLDIDYSTSTFDTDPFEPQPVAVHTIFPFVVKGKPGKRGFVELPYTLPQDFTLFIVLQEITIDIWKTKLDWIVAHRGMALVNVHPDYMNFNEGKGCGPEEYPVSLYTQFIRYVQDSYNGKYWNVLPEEISTYIQPAERGTNG